MNQQWAITIKPPYVEKIVSGVKAYEIRTRLPTDFSVGDEVFVVQGASRGKVVLAFKVESIVEGNPVWLWENFKRDLGVSMREFYFYTYRHEVVYLIKMTSIVRLQPPWTLKGLQLSRVPQWFQRVKISMQTSLSAALMPEKSAMSGR